jgi:hypothetical protein
MRLAAAATAGLRQMNEQKKAITPRIALLGWGSLIWDEWPEFDKYHKEWQPNGPLLPLEFSRVSETRKGALTLVIDPQYGTLCKTAYAVSTRRDPADAIADLRSREGTLMKRVGFYFANRSRTCEPKVPESIASWAAEMRFDVVVWTGLSSNFKDKKKEDYSVAAASRHIQSLSLEGKSMAAEYVWRAPAFVQTPLRIALQTLPWFLSLTKSTNDS